MRRPILLAAFTAALLAAPPLARACDPETMNAALTDVCDAALRPAEEAIAAALPHATAAEPLTATERPHPYCPARSRR